MASRRFLFAWRHALCSAQGPRHPADRHVALVLSLYFNGDGLGAWPSQQTLALRSGLAVRTIRPALARLVAGHWLSRVERKSPRGIRAKRWGYEYRARLPGKLAKGYLNGAMVALFTGKNPGPGADGENAASSAQRMRQPLPTNTAKECAKGTASRKGLLPEPQEIAEMEAAFAAVELTEPRGAPRESS